MHLPFLQALLPSFRLVPIVTGEANPAAVAEVVAPCMTDGVLLIASSDFSHYHPDAEARKIDRGSIDAILSGSVDGPIDACGATAVRTVMIVARGMGLTPVLLDARNSYETAPVMYKDESRVVGYASIAFVKKSAKEKR